MHYRSAKLCSYLPEYGWKVALADAYGVRYVRRESFEESGRASDMETVRGALRGERGELAADRYATRVERLFHFKKSLLRKFLLLPTGSSWAFHTTQWATTFVLREQFDAIYSLSPPPAAHWVARFLKKLTGRPWVADFKDPWTLAPWFHPPTPLHRFLARRLEQSILNTADAVVSNTERAREGFLSLCRGKNKFRKIRPITNGVDESDLAQVPEDKADVFVIVYAGSIYPGRSPEPFLAALTDAANAEPRLREESRVIFCGLCDPTVDIGAIARDLNIGDMIYVLGPLSHAASLYLMKSANVLLLLNIVGRGSDCIVPLKTYEYMALRKPILCLTHKGALWDLLEDYHSSRLAQPEDRLAISAAIHQAWRDWASGKDTPAQPLSAKYSFRSIANQVAVLLDEVCFRK